jgi:hypothetical protein
VKSIVAVVAAAVLLTRMCYWSCCCCCCCRCCCDYVKSFVIGVAAAAAAAAAAAVTPPLTGNVTGSPLVTGVCLHIRLMSFKLTQTLDKRAQKLLQTLTAHPSISIGIPRPLFSVCSLTEDLTTTAAKAPLLLQRCVLLPPGPAPQSSTPYRARSVAIISYIFFIT